MLGRIEGHGRGRVRSKKPSKGRLFRLGRTKDKDILPDEDLLIFFMKSKLEKLSQ